MGITAEQIEAGRERVVELFWHKAKRLYDLTFVPDKRVPTFAADQHGRIYYNPELDWDQEGVDFAVFHEVKHILGRHHKRAERLGVDDPWAWNVAADFEINPTIVGMGFRPPKGVGVFPKDKGLRSGGLAEHYYQHTRKEKQDEPEQEPGDGESSEEGEGKGSEGVGGGPPPSGDGEQEQEAGEPGGTGGPSGESAEPDDEGVDVDDGSKAGNTGDERPEARQDDPGTDEEAPGGDEGSPHESDDGEGVEGGASEEVPEPEPEREHDCGSVIGGEAREWERPVDDAQYPGMSEEEIEDLSRDIKDAIVTSTKPGKMTKMAEAVFGGLDSFDASLDKVWLARVKHEVSKYMKMKGRGFQRPSRRLTDRSGRVIYPGRSKVMPEIVAIVDVSGSINEKAAEKAFRVVNQFRGWGIRFRVVACDRDAKEIRPGDHGYAGGGTDMSAGLRYVSENMPGCDLCVIISDGENPEWGEKTRFPVVLFSWVYGGPEWMKTVMMPPLDTEPDPYAPQQKEKNYGKVYRRRY